jgi:glutamate synthase (ferredoxin)
MQKGLYWPELEHDACGIGMLCDIHGKAGHQMVDDAVQVLESLKHRGGVGADPLSGDGAGILTQIPRAFMRKVAHGLGFELPEERCGFGVAMLFVSPDPVEGAESVQRFRNIATTLGLKVLGQRKVATDPTYMGPTAAEAAPGIYQVFIERPENLAADGFEHRLYLLLKVATHKIRYGRGAERADDFFYVCSCSCQTIVYKGMLLPEQVQRFYTDLADPDYQTAIALVHSRFSTNTLPSWERAQPMRHIIHNGEINTIKGNAGWQKAREALMHSEVFGGELEHIKPVIDASGSDSAMLDDMVSFLGEAGYSLAEAMLICIPPAWEGNRQLPADVRAMHEYLSCLTEAWDGPASVSFSDGRFVGAQLDRNGLRPSRYYVTKDGQVILSSEVGVLPIAPERVLQKERLHPGKMLLVDTKEGRIIDDEELKGAFAARRPYRKWLDENLCHLSDLPLTAQTDNGIEEANSPLSGGSAAGRGGVAVETDTLLATQKLFGYTYEDIALTLTPLATGKGDPIGAMGYDAPLAVLSERPQLLYNYFKQMFAQVTNPPIDSIREELVTSTTVHLGAHANILTLTPENARVITHDTPILNPQDMLRLETLLDQQGADFNAVRIPMLFDAEDNLEEGLRQLFMAADAAVLEGHNILIISDRAADDAHLPIPALLATAGLHHHLIRAGLRTKCSIVVESGEPREVHHFCCLVGYGANAIYPYLAYESLPGIEGATIETYQKAVTSGLVKVMAKMGISTIRSYQGAQIFEAVGLSDQLIDAYFTGTVSPVGGIGLDRIEADVRARNLACDPHLNADGTTPMLSDGAPLPAGGEYRYRAGGEQHLVSPKAIYCLQQAVRRSDYSLFQEFSETVNSGRFRLRDLMDIDATDRSPISIDEVEPVESIVRRFKTGAMSFGSISQEAHECMAIAMNRLHGKSNSGEGGEDPARYVPDANGDSRSSAIKQVASGRFGVTIDYLGHAQEIQIKMAQGAKPGEGGHLPGKKVWPWVAKNRYSTPGVQLISPPPHHDIYSIEDLAQLIHDLKCANKNARINVKLVSEAGVGTIAVGVAKGLADTITISGFDGGTGAAARTSIRHAGLPWELGVAETHAALVASGLRERVRIETDGKLFTGRDIIVAACLGAEEFTFATAPLIAMGCDMMRVCNLDTCPVGIATQNPELRKCFQGKPEHIINFMRYVAQAAREIMAELGVRSIDELIGRSDLLKARDDEFCDFDGELDFSRLLHFSGAEHNQVLQEHHLEATFDESKLLQDLDPQALAEAAAQGHKKELCYHISNRDRTLATELSHAIDEATSGAGLPPESVVLELEGSGGQSFGAYLCPGVELRVSGDVNDYLGKGLSGGIISVRPPVGSTFPQDQNIICGNVAFYGATAGEAYLAGVAGERFCVRNSGVTAVVEGVGDHGCEYMTGGRVLILGPTGRNFAAGMSGGIAYVWDQQGTFADDCNQSGLTLSKLDDRDREYVHELLRKHAAYTDSVLANRLLAAGAFERFAEQVVKVVPDAYQ